MNSKRGNQKDGIPRYTGLKDFARGVQKLYEMHGNLPVFLQVNESLAPFGLALVSGCCYIDGQTAIAFCAHANRAEGCKYEKGTVTE